MAKVKVDSRPMNSIKAKYKTSSTKTKNRTVGKRKNRKLALDHDDGTQDDSSIGPDWNVLMDDSDDNCHEDNDQNNNECRDIGCDDIPRYNAKSTASWNNRQPSVIEKLPIKCENGQLIAKTNENRTHDNFLGLVWKAGERNNQLRANLAIVTPDEENSSKPSEIKTDGCTDKTPEKEERPSSSAEWFSRRQRKKVEIASLAETVMSDPENGVNQSKKLAGNSQIGLLLLLASDDMDRSVRKLATLTLVAVFKDILPGYRINLEAVATDKDTKLTKKVRQLKLFEHNLLQKYQQFLKLLNKLCVTGLGPVDSPQYHASEEELLDESNIVDDKLNWNNNGNENICNDSVGKHAMKPVNSEALVAIRGMCTLLVAKPNANYRENILDLVIQRINSTDSDVRAQCFAAVSTILEEDVNGEATLQVATYVCNFIKSRNHGLHGSVHPDICRLLLHSDLKGDLKIDSTLEKAKRDRKARSRKRKRGDDISTGLEEAEAGVDMFQRQACNVEALRAIFTMYLRIVRKAPQSSLLPMVLKGIARYLHLINMELAQALVTALTELIRNDAVRIDIGLQAVNSVALTLRGPGSELKIDESDLVNYLYRTILKVIVSECDRDKMVPLVVKCVESLILGRKLYQHNRAAAFTTRLAILANFVSPHATLALVSIIRMITTRYASVCQFLFDGEDDSGGSLLEPDLSKSDPGIDGDPIFHGAGGVLWPLAQLRFHYHPEVRSFVKKALKRDLLMPIELPQRMFASFNAYTDGSFNPPVVKTLQLARPKKIFRVRLKNS